MMNAAMSSIVQVPNRRGESLFVDYMRAPNSKGSIIYCCTPIMPVLAFQYCYAPFIDHGYSVYAMDFAATGNSSGNVKSFTLEGMCDDFERVISFARQNEPGPVFLFGNTRIGGVFAQYYATISQNVSGLAQLGCGIYNNTLPLSYPPLLTRTAYPLIRAGARLAPGMKVPYLIPSYTGYYADQEDLLYTSRLHQSPGLCGIPITLLNVLMEMFLGKKSAMQYSVSVPTLVFKTLHDRYYPSSYFDDYYDRLTCPKKIIPIRHVHTSFMLHPELFAAHVAAWFDTILGLRKEEEAIALTEGFLPYRKREWPSPYPAQ